MFIFLGNKVCYLIENITIFAIAKTKKFCL